MGLSRTRVAADRLGGDRVDVGSNFDNQLTGLERRNAREGIGACCGRPHGRAACICGVCRLDGATAAAPFNAGSPAELIKTKPDRWLAAKECTHAPAAIFHPFRHVLGSNERVATATAGA